MIFDSHLQVMKAHTIIILLKMLQLRNNHQRCFIKKVLLNILQNLHGSTCVGVSFLIKLQDRGLQKETTPTQVFSCEFFLQLFYKAPPGDSFWQFHCIISKFISSKFMALNHTDCKISQQGRIMTKKLKASKQLREVAP